MIHRLEKGYLLPEQTSLLYSSRETLARLQTPASLLMTGLEQKLPGMTVEKKIQHFGEERKLLSEQF